MAKIYVAGYVRSPPPSGAVVTTPAKILALDPGAQGIGWSAWGYGVLIAAGFARVPPADRKLPLARRAEILAVQIPGGPDVCILEEMRHYPRVDKSQPNDLLAVQLVGAFTAGLLQPVKFQSVTAPDWKGHTPKKVTRVRVLKALDADELAIYSESLFDVPPSLQHNLTDGVALGLWLLRRKPVWLP